jgi:hypothetical protein
MRYFQVKTYGELERVTGRPLIEPVPCRTCGRMKRVGETELTVRFVVSPPFPDAVGVLFGPEWAVSGPLRALIDSMDGAAASYARMLLENGEIPSYEQVLVNVRLRVGVESVRGGNTCDECGGYAQLSLDPLYLKRPESAGPLLACLLESPAVVLMREDLVEAIRRASLDIDLFPVFFEGEVAPASGPTSEGQDWSDVRS